VANWIMGPVLGLMKSQGLTIEKIPVSATELSKLLSLVEDGKLNTGTAKTVFEEMTTSDKAPLTIMKEKGLEQVSDQSELDGIVVSVIEANPGEHDAYKNGKTKLFSFFMGQIMKKTKGKADPKVVTDLLKQNL